MKLSENQKQNLDAFAWTQLVHDRAFHADIYVLNTHSTLKHFTLHQAKYLHRIFNTLDDGVNLLALADMFIILTATQTATKAKLSDLFVGVSLPAGHIQDNYNLLMLLINGVSLSAKVCEGLDHVEKQDYHANLKCALGDIAEAIWQLCNWGEDITKHISIEMLIRMAKARLLQVEIGSPQFIELKRETFDSNKAWNAWFSMQVISPLIRYLRDIHAGKYHWVDEDIADKNGALNTILASPYKAYAIRVGYVEQALDGVITLTKLGRQFISVESSE